MSCQIDRRIKIYTAIERVAFEIGKVLKAPQVKPSVLRNMWNIKSRRFQHQAVNIVHLMYTKEINLKSAL